MAKIITAEQYDELSLSDSTFTFSEFLKLLEEYTGITARPYTAYQYFDVAGNFLTNSDEASLDDLLNYAGIEVST